MSLNTSKNISISKSKYVRAIQCPKMLWMDNYKPEKGIVDNSVESRFEAGNEVGELAREYFGKCELVDFDKGIKSMLEQTECLVKSAADNIAEASFSIDGLFCSVDILHKTSQGWEIYEVKSSTHLTPIYVEDMAFQYYVLSKAGLNITGVYNMHINSSYIREGELNLNELFTIEDCTSMVVDKQAEVDNNINYIRNYMISNGDTEPISKIALHCEEPYVCQYKDYCWRDIPKPSVFDIHGRLSKKKKYALFDSDIISFADVINKNADLTDDQLLQVKSDYYDLPEVCKRDKIKECLNEFAYPLYFLDFETFQQVVPKYDGISPYVQIPFQYSLHAYKYRGAELEHYEFLGKEGTDPRRTLAEQLCQDIPLNVCTMAYNMSFEKSVIKRLANTYPDLRFHLMNIHDNIRDLMIPFQMKYYYSKALQGSYSIKYVLPALCPGDPELDYHALNGIHNGGEAMNAFATLDTLPPDEIAQTRKNLLAYCRLDTLAMVKVFEKLNELCK